MNRSNELMRHMERVGLAAALIVSALALGRQQALAQTPAPAAGQTSAAGQISAAGQTSAAGEISEDEQYFRDIYREFYETYRLGPADEIAIRVTGQPDYTIERAKVSPTGNV